MAGTIPSAQVIRFATFEVNLRSGEIRKAGMKLKLGGQPFQVLAILLERPGEMVTRDELQKRLWPDTFVDIDHNLNTAINKIREVLGDSAESPRFVETVPRRGYRFIAYVNGSSANDANSSLEVAISESTRRWDAPEVRSVPFFRSGFAGAGLAALVLVVVVMWWLAPGKWPRVVASTRLTITAQAAGPLGLFWKEFPALVTDGNRIYFTMQRNGPVSLAYVPSAGGDPALVQTPLHGQLCHISPDGSMLLVLGTIPGDLASHLWFVSAGGGGPRRLGEIDGLDGAWSPDAQEIAYSKDRDLYIAHGDGSGSRKLATINGTAHWLRWSPDAKRIRFTLVEAKTSITSLWECRVDGGNLHRVVTSAEKQRAECCGEWSADGHFFFFRTLDKNHSEIWQKREDGLGRRFSTPRVLTTGPLDVAAAVPSKDGQELFTIEVQPRAKLVKYDVGTRRLEPYLPQVEAHMAGSSRDGQWIAYVEVRGPENVLWRSRVDGSDKLPLTEPMKAIAWPKWSPNGKQIAFAAENTGRPSMAYVVDAAGGAPRAVLPADHLYVDPNWSPDGKMLMVGRMPDYMGEPGTRKVIELVDLETNKVTELEGSEGLFSPHWSLDGRFVAASSLDQQKLMLYDFSTRTWRERVSASADHGLHIDSAQWSPDSRYIYYNNSTQAAVMRVSPGTEDPVAVLNLKTVDPNASYCAFVDTTSDGSLTIHCWFDGGDIYRLKLE